MKKITKIFALLLLLFVLPFAILLDIWDVIIGKTDEDERDDWNQRRDY